MAQRVRSLTERTWTIATNVCCQYVFVLKHSVNSSSFNMSFCVYLESTGKGISYQREACILCSLFLHVSDL